MAYVLRPRQSLSVCSHKTHILDDDVSDAQIINIVQDLKEDVKFLTIENEILENTIRRYNPAINFESFYQNLENQKISRSFGSDISRYQSKSSRQSLGAIPVYRQPINITHRASLVSFEIEQLAKDIENTEKKALKKEALFNAKLDEIDERVPNITRAEVKFQQQVIEDGWDRISQRIAAEAWVAFMNDWDKFMDRFISKLRLRISGLNVRYRALKGEIMSKSELHDRLNAIEFETLNIENKVAQRKLKERTVQWMFIKRITAEAHLRLFNHQKALEQQRNYLLHMRDEIQVRRKNEAEITKESEIIAKQAMCLGAQVEYVKELQTKYVAPSVQEYVEIAEERSKLRHSVMVLRRKLKVMKFSLSSYAQNQNRF